LEWNTASARANDRFAFVDALGDLDFEALAGGELEDDLGARHESIQNYSKWSTNFPHVREVEIRTLVTRRNAHNDNAENL